METVTDFIILGSKINVDDNSSHEIQRLLLLERKAMNNLDSILKSRDVTLRTKVCLVKAMTFPVVMYGCEMNHKEAEHQRVDAFELWCWRRLLNPLPCTIKPVNPKGNKSWIFIGWTDAEAEAPILWTPDAKNWLIGKDSDAGKDRRWEEKGTTEDEMVGWHPWLNGQKFEQAPGVGDGQGSLACCSPWGHKESDTTEWLNWTDFYIFYFLTLQYCIGFAIYQHASATGIHVLPILNPPPSSLPIPSLWVIPEHQWMALKHVSHSSDPVDSSPPSSSAHEISQSRTLEWVAIFFSNKTHKLSLRLIWTCLQIGE